MSPKKGTVLAQNDHAPDEARLANLHGDIIATASTNEVESKLIPANETSEYGVPRTTVTEKYSWLGADQVPTELPTGIIDMGARTYIPQLGRFEQTDPQPGGSANAYAYTDDDPINESDPSGEYTSTVTYDYEAAELGPAAPGLPQEYAGPGAIFPQPVNMQIEEEFNAHPPWDAPSAFDGGATEDGGAREGGDRGGFGRFANNVDPGVPPGAQCEGSVNSNKYKKEHPTLCHEITQSPLAPLDGFCLTAGAFNPFTGYECAAYDLARAATK